MKKGCIITGFILIILGVVALAYAATRDDFKQVLNGNVEVEELIFKTDNINTIKFDACAENLIIKKSNDSQIKIMNKKSEGYTYIVAEDVASKTLCISQDIKNGFLFDISTLFSINEPKYEIYVPENLELEILIDAGNLDVENVNLEKLNIKINAGNLDVVNAIVNNSDITVSAGNMDVKKSTFSNLVSTVNAGNLDIESKIINNAKIDINAGNLNLKLIGNQDIYNVNGNNPSGTVNITYDIDAGNKDIIYQLDFN